MEISDFREIREKGYYFIDKTFLIRELLKTTATKVTLITRPRRFGKTLAMSMLQQFFDIRVDGRKLFEGLEIIKNESCCKEWMNQYPVLFLTLKNIDGLTFDNAYGQLKYEISELYKEHSYLLKSEKTDQQEAETFRLLQGRKGDEIEVQRSLQFLMQLMQKHYGKQVILLLDEYDVPLAKASSHGYYKEMLEVLRLMLSTALKDNSSLQFAVLTGCLRISKESIFTGVNNFTTDTVSDHRYNEFFGFTQKEVQRLLLDARHSEQMEVVKRWYDGYRFGNLEIYCPWDVLNYVTKLLTENKTVPENFWENTSDNAIIRAFLERTDFDVTEKFEVLLNGGSIKEEITETLTYDFLLSSESNLWSLLYFTGYLTKAKEDFGQENCSREKQAILKIPNEEVMDIFQKSVMEWFEQKSLKSDRTLLFQSVWNGNSAKLTEIFSDLLFDTISYHDYAENFYHAFLAGLMSGSGYIIESNYENGIGRSDVVIKDKAKRRAAVFEAKIADSEEMLERECISALKQIEEKQYARKLERSGFKTVHRFGIAFYKKECLVKNQIG